MIHLCQAIQKYPPPGSEREAFNKREGNLTFRKLKIFNSSKLCKTTQRTRNVPHARCRLASTLLKGLVSTTICQSFASITQPGPSDRCFLSFPLFLVHAATTGGERCIAAKLLDTPLALLVLWEGLWRTVFNIEQPPSVF